MNKFILVVVLLIVNISFAVSQLNVDSWLDRGKSKIIAGNYLSAIDDFSTVIRYVPDLNDAYYFRAIAKFYLNDNRGAIDDYTTAIHTKPYFSNFYSNYFLNRGLAKERIHDYKGALDDYNQAIEVKPGNQEAYICRGIIYINQKKYDNAIADFTKIIVTLNPKYSFAYMYRAIAKQCQDMRDDAMADFAKALKLDPKNSDIYLRRGMYHCELKEYTEGIADFNKSITLDSASSLVYFQRARAEMEMTDYTNAMKDFNKAIDLDNDNDLIYYCRAELKAKVGDLKGAIDDYSNVISISPGNVFTYFNRGIIWHRLDNHRKAIDDYTTVIQLYANFSPAWINRSIARQSIKDYKGAALDYQKAKSLNASLDSLKIAGKLDTSILFKLMDFKADFGSSANIALDGFDSNFIPFPNFVIGYSSKDTLRNYEYVFNEKLDPSRNEKILELNNSLPSSDKFTLTYKEDSLSPQKATQWLSILESQSTDSIHNSQMFAQAILKYKAQDYNGALVEYNKIIEQSPQFSLAYFNRANARYGIINMIRSMNDYNKVIVIDNVKQVVQQLPNERFKNSDFDDVIKDYSKCLKLDTTFYYAHYNLSNVLIELKDYSGAIDGYNKAIAIEPKFGEAYYNRGLTYIYIRQTQQGCVDLSKAGELGIKKSYVAIKKFCSK